MLYLVDDCLYSLGSCNWYWSFNHWFIVQCTFNIWKTIPIRTSSFV